MRELRYDCDYDALLVLVEPAGPACHTGNRSCFYRTLEFSEIAKTMNNTNVSDIIRDLYAVVMSRKGKHEEGSYTCYLFSRNR